MQAWIKGSGVQAELGEVVMWDLGRPNSSQLSSHNITTDYFLVATSWSNISKLAFPQSWDVTCIGINQGWLHIKCGRWSALQLAVVDSVVFCRKKVKEKKNRKEKKGSRVTSEHLLSSTFVSNITFLSVPGLNIWLLMLLCLPLSIYFHINKYRHLRL